MTAPVYLIDGNGFIWRAFFSRPPLTATDNTPANAVVGFVEMMAHLMKHSQGARMGIFFDRRQPTWRHRRFAEYKAHRQPMPGPMAEQFVPIMRACDALSLPRIEMDGFEADDMIATYTRESLEREQNVVIVSVDKDMMQLVDDKAIVAMFDPSTKQFIDEPAVIKKWECAPKKLCDMFALAGDASDNIPGVPGIGAKTAAELVNKFDDLEGVIANWQQVTKKRGQLIRQYAADARMSKELVTLRNDAPLPIAFDALCAPKPDPAQLRRFLDWLGPSYVPEAMREFA